MPPITVRATRRDVQYVYSATHQMASSCGETLAYPAYTSRHGHDASQIGETWVGDSNQNGVRKKRMAVRTCGTPTSRAAGHYEIWHYQTSRNPTKKRSVRSRETFVSTTPATESEWTRTAASIPVLHVCDTNRNGDGRWRDFPVQHVLPGVDAPATLQRRRPEHGRTINEGESGCPRQLLVTHTTSTPCRRNPDRRRGPDARQYGLALDRRSWRRRRQRVVPIDRIRRSQRSRRTGRRRGADNLSARRRGGRLLRYSIVITTRQHDAHRCGVRDPLLEGTNGTLSLATNPGLRRRARRRRILTTPGLRRAVGITNNGGDPLARMHDRNIRTAHTTQQPRTEQARRHADRASGYIP